MAHTGLWYAAHMVAQRPSIAREDYLQTIVQLEEEGIPVIRARLAERLEVSAPSVSEAVRGLEDDKVVTIRDRRFIDLTDEGRDLADDIVRRHRVAERILTDLLELPWHVAHEEAHQLEHGLSDRVVDAALEVLGNPTTCPHGNPIPGTTYAAPDIVGLGELGNGQRFRVERVSESIEIRPDLMRYFSEAGFRPGASAVVHAVDPDGTMSVDAEDGPVSIDHEMVQSVYVSLLP